MSKKLSSTVSIKNKKAGFDYEFIDKYEAGIKLLGTEIKSIREGKASIKEGYCAFSEDELYVYNVSISPYENASFKNHAEKRARKLLLHKKELEKLQKKVQDVGLTIVPTLLFVNNKGFAKLNIAIAKGKKLYDKRENLKEKDTKRDLDRIKKNF